MFNKNHNLFIIGSGGFAKEVAWLIESTHEWNIVGFIDKELGKKIYKNYRIVGNDDFIINKKETTYLALGIGDPRIKKLVVDKYKKYDHVQFPNLIHPSVIMSDTVTIGRGSIICAGTILTTDIEIEQFVTINLNCTIGHDVTIKKLSSLMPSVNVSGNVCINTGTYFGTGSQIIHKLNIGSNVIVGAGAVVINDLPDNCTAIGVPAKIHHYH